MEKKYTGSLNLEWFNKNKAIIIQKGESIKNGDIPAPVINWINKDDALFYEIDEKEGKGVKPFWVNQNDIRVKEARQLIFKKSFKAIRDKQNNITIDESETEDDGIDNVLIKGDNLLVLNSLIKQYEEKPENQKIKCIYIDPPYNSENAFEDYDDNLEHSQWLTMMRDRLEQMKKLLSNDGFLVCQIDDKEMPYLLILIHQIFGRQNTKVICVKMAEPTGLKMASVINKGSIPKLKEYLIVAGVSGIHDLDIERVSKQAWDDEYRTILNNFTKEDSEFLKNIRENPQRTELDIQKVDSILSKVTFHPLNEEYKKYDIKTPNDKYAFNIENAWRIIQIASISGGAKKIAEGKNTGDLNAFSIITPKGMMYLIKGGFDNNEQIPRIKILFADDYLTVHPGDFWSDIKTTGLDNEGNVELKKSKKPEKLIYRVIKMTTKENDIVLDCFGGSGTTFSVAHKMKRRWIGIEIGRQAETKIIPRLKGVLAGQDQSPLVEQLKWQGGGEFKYLELGDSIVKVDSTKKIDFNWELGIKHIQETLLMSYEFIIDKNINLGLLSLDKQSPVIGIRTINSVYSACIVSLAHPDDKNQLLSKEEIFKFYNLLKDKFHDITILTNKGVEIYSKEKPENLEIIKVPQAIFSELSD